MTSPAPTDRFYRRTRGLARFVMSMTSSPTILHAERTERPGRWILAANHVSPYDVAVIGRTCDRVIDWVSITEVWERPFLRWFCENMGAFPIDRSKADIAGLRMIHERLEQDRVIGIFPEGRLVQGGSPTMLEGGSFQSGVGKIAARACAPIVPCVHMGTANLAPPHRWLPLRLQRYGLIFGEPLEPDPDLPRKAAAKEIEARLTRSMEELHAELLAAFR